jgi:tetratricopeptide (TPR) repeat protein
MSDKNPNGLLIDLDPITINDNHSIPHYIYQYRFNTDVFWMIFDRYGSITDSAIRVESCKKIAELLIQIYTPEEYRIAENLARLYKSAKDEKRSQQYQRMADLNQSLGLLYQQGLTIINSHNEDWKDREFSWAIALLSTLSKKMKYHFSFLECELIFKEVYDIAAKHYGPEFDTTINCLNDLGIFYADYGKYDEAEPLLKQALEIRERVLDPDHPDTADSLNNLAGLYNNQGRYSDAEPIFKRALEIRERVLGANHSDTADSLNNLAILYKNQGRYSDAEPLLKRALEIRERMLEADHPDTAASLK